MNGTQDVRFDQVLYYDSVVGGKRQFGTVWIVETQSGSLGVEKKFLVSSVDDGDFGVMETMIFPYDDTGEVLYLEVWSDHEFRSNASQHARFVMEYLEAQNLNRDGLPTSVRMTASESVRKFGIDLC